MMFERDKKRAENFVIDSAYETVTPEIAAKLDAIFKRYPHLQKVYVTHRELKSCLRHVETPDHQLSNERLRTAILKSPASRNKNYALDWWLVSSLGLVTCLGLLSIIHSLGHADYEQDSNSNSTNQQFENVIGFEPSVPVLSNDQLSVPLRSSIVYNNVFNSSAEHQEASSELTSFFQQPFEALRNIVPGIPPPGGA